MALPIDYDTVQVRGKYTYLDGTPARGAVRFTGKVPAVSAATKTIIMPATISVVLADDGSFAVNLPATNDPDIQPNGWTYTVLEQLSSGGGRTYDIDVPLVAKEFGIDLADVAPADAALGDPTAFATLTHFETFREELDTQVSELSSTVTAGAIAAAGPAGQAAALSVVGPSVQTSRRIGMANRALLNAGGWIIKRRSVDEYRLMRDVGDGFVADHQLLRSSFPSIPGSATGPGGEPRPVLLNEMGIGIPMLPVPYANGTFTGTGWNTLRGYFNLQDALPTLGVDMNQITVSTTAGSTTVTVTSAPLTPDTRYNTRRIVIPGAGAGGAALVTSIGFVNTGGASFVANNAAGTAVTNVTATIYPARRYNTTTDSVASYTAPLGATSVGVVFGTGGNGGFSTVAIDGDLTRATFLPTAQQLVDLNQAPASMLTTGGGTVSPTTRILDCYSLGEAFALWQALASGLDPTVQHTVTITVSGYKRPAAIATTLIVGGFGYGTATTGPTTATAVPFLAIRTSYSVPDELVFNHKPTGLSNSVFVGGSNHGYEYETQALTLVVDGTPVTLTDDQAVPVAGNATLVRRSAMYHTQNTTTPTAIARITYRLDRTGLIFNGLLEAKAQTVVDSAYFGGYSALHFPMNRVQVDKDATAYTTTNFATYPEGTYMGTGFNTGAAWWDAAGEAVVVMLVPTAKEQTGGWSDGIVYASVMNRPATMQGSKWYARRKGTMDVGTKWAGEVTYIISRLPDGANNYFPVV